MKKLLLIGALSVSSFIQANTKEVSKTEEKKTEKETKVYIKPITFVAQCKYHNYPATAPEGTSFEGLLAIANQICSTDKPDTITSSIE